VTLAPKTLIAIPTSAPTPSAKPCLQEVTALLQCMVLYVVVISTAVLLLRPAFL